MNTHHAIAKGLKVKSQGQPKAPWDKDANKAFILSGHVQVTTINSKGHKVSHSVYLKGELKGAK